MVTTADRFGAPLVKRRSSEPAFGFGFGFDYGDGGIAVLLSEGYVVSRYDDVRTVLADGWFSRAAMPAEGAPRLTAAPPTVGTLFTVDPPEHTWLRGLVSREFTARRVQKLRPRIQELTDWLLDEMEKLSGPVDLNPVFAFPLPVMVICEVLGVHDEDGGRLSEYELITMGITLLVADHETTVSKIGTCVVTFLRHPGHLAALRENPGTIDHVVEELLRSTPSATAAPSASG
ncbi:hypothetical protein AB0D11_33810 [Streptomyces monashensis]|uniref:hypothetical protein n=1 Tax=Streptomyces monashensis TaxID=1678012 RepID=UPI0033C2F0E6